MMLHEVPRGTAVNIDGKRYYVRRTDGMYTQLVKHKKDMENRQKWGFINCCTEVELWKKQLESANTWPA